MKANFERDLTKGSIFKNLIIYALPLLATNFLQMLFKTADVMVLGIFVDPSVSGQAVAGVGATGSLIDLLLGLFLGLAVGANVIIARYVGENNKEGAEKAIGTAVLLSLIFGVIIAGMGYFGARTFLTWMKCDPNVIDYATKYLQIYFLGMPVIMLYDFTAAILRAVGDTLRPLIYLLVAGVVNIGLNIFFVVVFKMNVEGVAIATVASQGISAVLATIALLRSKGYGQLKLSRLRFYRKEFVAILKIGIPSGVQTCMFAISNVIIQSSINFLGQYAMEGSSTANQFDTFVYQIICSMQLAAVAFTSQNYGAKDFKRIRKTIFYSLIMVVVATLAVGSLIFLFSDPLCRIISHNEEALYYAKVRLGYLCLTYFICGVMDVLNGVLCGFGKSIAAMIISITGSVVLRIMWFQIVFPLFPNIHTIFMIYPITWVITSCISIIVLFIVFKKKQLDYSA